jgi:hypothetical protein
MDNILAYTLKHNTIADTFEDVYIVFKDDEHNNEALKKVTDLKDKMLLSDGNRIDWHIWTINIAQIIFSTD